MKSQTKKQLKRQIPKVKRQRMSSKNNLKPLLERRQREKIQNKMRRQNLEREMEMRRKQKKSKKKKQLRMRNNLHQSLRKERSICITHSQRETMAKGLLLRSML